MGLYLTERIVKDKSIVYPHFIYHHKGKRTKIHSGVTCLLKDWNRDLKKVLRTDPDFKLKNLKISSLNNRIDEVINRYTHEGNLTPQQLLIELKNKLDIKEVSSLSTVPLYTLIIQWEKEYMEDDLLEKSTKSKVKSVVKDIKDFVKELEIKESRTLLIKDLNEKFNRELIKWCFNKPIPIKRNDEGVQNLRIGLQPKSVERRFRYLQSFCKWYSKNSREYTRIEIPRELTKSTRVSSEDEPICFFQTELEKLWECSEFNFYKSIKSSDNKLQWVENDSWKKYLSIEKRNSKNLHGVVEFFYENTKEGMRTYTNWEVYLDLMVFLSSVGCRFSDAVKMKLNNFQHKKRNNDSPIEGGVEAFFVFSQKKTNTTAIPRVNEISFDIYKKYSKGKSKNDFLFPRTERGNPISDVHFNKHIKTISKVLGFNRKVVKRVIGSKGRELQREEKQLWEVVSSHCGRKTFIKTLVLNEDYTTREIMSQTGHSSEKVFHQYYKLRERDLLKKVNPLFLKKQSNYQVKDNDRLDVEEVDVEIFPQKQLSIKEKLQQLQELVGLEYGITQEEFELKRKEILNSF